jgi:predicted transcriptional regulator
VRRLPTAYSLALRLRDAGVSEELIAECLQIERAAVKPLLVVAEAKVQAILREPFGVIDTLLW